MFNRMSIDQIGAIDIEPTSFCNAGCPHCSRHKFGTSDLIDALTLKHLPYEVFLKLKDDFGNHSKNVKLWMGGILGDALMHPHFVKIWDYGNIHFSDTEVETNGGGRTTEFWRDLGKISAEHNKRTNDTNKSKVYFSIDGLEDTNHLYRRKVDWNKLMDNAQAYINAGGNAYWKFLIFEHNEHQVDEAKQLAKKLGFTKFDSRYATRHTSLSLIQPEHIEKIIPKKKLNSSTQLSSKVNTVIKDTIVKHKISTRKKIIECKSIKQKRMYLNSKGRIWPCCWHSEKYDKYDDLREMDPMIKSYYLEGFNDYFEHSLAEIFSSPLWKEMTDAWDSGNGMPVCQKKCMSKKWELFCNIKDTENTEIFKQANI